MAVLRIALTEDEQQVVNAEREIHQSTTEPSSLSYSSRFFQS